MKSRTVRSIATVITAAMLVSACGSGSETSTKSRKRNGVLDSGACVATDQAAQKVFDDAKAASEALATSLNKKQRDFNKAQKAYAKERKHKPKPRKP